MITDWTKVKVYQIAIGQLPTPYTICDMFKDLAIEDYVYEIKCNNITIKFGMSIKTLIQSFGERLYRQLGHIPSWKKAAISGSSGDEFLEVITKVFEAYGIVVDHKDVTITVWDFTNYPYKTVNHKKEIEEAESELIMSYAKFHNQLPIGNINDGTKAKNRAAVLADVYQNHFEEV